MIVEQVLVSEKRASQWFKNHGFNYVTVALEPAHIDKAKDHLRAKYMTDLECACVPTKIDGRKCQLVGFKIPHLFLFPPKLIQ